MGKTGIQNEDVKSLADLQAASPAGVISQLINDTKIYVSASSGGTAINDTLYNAITAGKIGGGSGGALVASSPPTVQKFLNGSGTYTTPANVSYIRVRIVGGGGGGAAAFTTAGNSGTAGGNTTFGTSLLVANGGAGGVVQVPSGGAGGTASLGSGPIGTAINGATGGSAGFGNSSTITILGGDGGGTPFGGRGPAGTGVATGLPIQNSGSGGGGGSGTRSGVNEWSGSGGGAGGFVDAIINSPSATYAYSIGAGGTGGTGGTASGGNGAYGYIEVTEYYLSSGGGGGAVVPTVQKFLSGSGTYTKPAGVSYIEVTVVGGGGGGAASQGGVVAGSNGTSTTFGTASAGNGFGAPGKNGGAGGTFSLGSIIGFGVGGGSGTGSFDINANGVPGGPGGNSALGGGGGGGGRVTAGSNGTANTGGGGGGQGPNDNQPGSGGGGAGAYICGVIGNPAATYSYSVGAGGAGAVASGYSGGAGGSGMIEVIEYYANGAVGTATNVTGIVAVANGGTGKSTVLDAHDIKARTVIVKKTGGGTAANNAWTTLTGWDAAIKDSDAAFSSSPGVFTALVSGDYLFTFSVGMAGTTPTNLGVRLLYNSTTAHSVRFYPGATIGLASAQTTKILTLSAGDTMQFQYYNNGSGTSSFDTNPSQAPEISIAMMGT